METIAPPHQILLPLNEVTASVSHSLLHTGLVLSYGTIRNWKAIFAQTCFKKTKGFANALHSYVMPKIKCGLKTELWCCSSVPENSTVIQQLSSYLAWLPLGVRADWSLISAFIPLQLHLLARPKALLAQVKINGVLVSESTLICWQEK